MKKHQFVAIGLALLLTLLIVHNALAMSSTNFRIEWILAGNGGGGGAMTSTNYAVRFTVGQSSIESVNSASYHGTLGYWHVIFSQTYLPIIMR